MVTGKSAPAAAGKGYIVWADTTSTGNGGFACVVIKTVKPHGGLVLVS